MNWYIVTGRVSGDDEDSVDIFNAESPDAAEELFIATMREFDPDPDLEIYINFVIACAKHEPKVVRSPP